MIIKIGRVVHHAQRFHGALDLVQGAKPCDPHHRAVLWGLGEAFIHPVKLLESRNKKHLTPIKKDGLPATPFRTDDFALFTQPVKDATPSKE